MNRDKLLRQWLPESISLNPIGRNAEEIQKADISSLRGFGELTKGRFCYQGSRDFLHL